MWTEAKDGIKDLNENHIRLVNKEVFNNIIDFINIKESLTNSNKDFKEADI